MQLGSLGSLLQHLQDEGSLPPPPPSPGAAGVWQVDVSHG